MRALPLMLVCCAAAAEGEAQEAPGLSEPGLFRLESSVKATGLVSRARGALPPLAERVSAVSLWRLRLSPELRPASWLVLSIAYEQRLQVQSEASGPGALGPLPALARAPYRVTQAEGAIATGGQFSWRQELDRAQATFHLERAELTVGRQAIGWGRGVVFGAVDIFAPFTPLEVDREWRRGVDALRVDLRLGDKTSVDLVAAFGESVDESAFAARARSDFGVADVELVGGRRGRDPFCGATSSAAVLGAEVHGELAFFWLPAPQPRMVSKAVLGASYQVAVGDGLNLVAEYHYSGLGSDHPGDLASLLADPDFVARYLRGDTQILGQHAVAALATYSLGMTGSVTLELLVDPNDGSGLVMPMASLDLGENVTLLAGAYFPTSTRGQFGATPLAGLVQLRVYDARALPRAGP